MIDEFPSAEIGDEELAAVKLKASRFHGEWNYRILPSRKKK